MRDEFDAAGIEYAFLHAWSETRDLDSDVDIVVRSDHLGAVEAILRLGHLGRLVQRLDYDIPFCRYYVVETGLQDRPFRQLDVACDPFGISRYGRSLSCALNHVHRQDGLPVLEPAARTVYLAAKRARKGLRSPADIETLRRAFAEDQDSAHRSLQVAFGAAGESLAIALSEGKTASGLLADIAVAIDRSRRRPRALFLRAVFGGQRLLRRAALPTGLTVQLVGPDGAGKSTVAEGLRRELRGAFRRYVRLHFGPGVLPPPAKLIRKKTINSVPHDRVPSGALGSLARIAYLGADYAVGWWLKAALPRRRSGLVVLERGWQDLAVDGRRYRLGTGQPFVRALSRLIPRADVTLLLGGDAEAIENRKKELSRSEISRQIARWRILLRTARQGHEVDAVTSQAATRQAYQFVVDHLARRTGDLSPFSAVAVLGVPRADGSPLSLVSAGGRPRWLLPSGRGSLGPSGSLLHRPMDWRYAVGSVGLEGIQRAGLYWSRLTLDSEAGLGPILGEILEDRIELACLLPTDPLRSDRLTLAANSGRDVRAIVKVGPLNSAELRRERSMLEVLANVEFRILVVPRVLAAFEWRAFSVLVTSAIPARGRTSRPLGDIERNALRELARCGAATASSLGESGGEALVHGDFCGWNSSHLRGGRLGLWDWEWSRFGLPLEDYFHWKTQHLINFDRGSPEHLVRSALEPSAELSQLCDMLGFDASRAPEALATSLHESLKRSSGSHATSIRRAALRLLEGDSPSVTADAISTPSR